MSRTLIILLALLVVACVGHAVVVRVMPVAGSAAMQPKPKSTEPLPAAAENDPAGYDRVEVKLVIPPLTTFPSAWNNEHGCAHNRLSRVLGASLSQGNGVIVFALAKGGAAERAGIKPGDRLGESDQCPSSLEGSFAPGKAARTMSWTVRRPKTARIREKAAEEAAAHPLVIPGAAKGKAAGDRASGIGNRGTAKGRK